MKTLVTTLALAPVLAAALPEPAVRAGTDMVARPTITSHHEETPHK